MPSLFIISYLFAFEMLPPFSCPRFQFHAMANCELFFRWRWHFLHHTIYACISYVYNKMHWNGFHFEKLINLEKRNGKMKTVCFVHVCAFFIFFTFTQDKSQNEIYITFEIYRQRQKAKLVEMKKCKMGTKRKSQLLAISFDKYIYFSFFLWERQDNIGNIIIKVFLLCHI